MILIKLGGSVITDKGSYKSFREETVKRLVEEIKERKEESKEEFIIMHGAGSFGHILAKAFELNRYKKNFQLKEEKLENEVKDLIKKMKLKNQLNALSIVQKDVKELNLKILNILIESGINAISLPPSSFVEFENKEICKANFEILRKFMGLGLTPILFGDVVIDRKIGFTICSADDLMQQMAKEFSPKLTIFVFNEDGIYDNFRKKNQKLMKNIDKNFLIKLKKEKKEEVSDATGGIIKKIESALKIAEYSKTLIINGNVKNRLKDAIIGKEVVGTEVMASSL